MQTYAQLITELFDKPAKWKLESDSPTGPIYNAVIDGKELDVVFSAYDKTKKGYIFELTFTIDGTTEAIHRDKKNQFKIMATVMSCIADFVKRHKPYIVSFSGSKDRNRAKLYERMLKRFANDSEYSTYVKKTDEETIFELKRR